MLKPLLIALLILTDCYASALGDPPVTYWWRTVDAAVVGIHHPIDQCTLVLFNRTQSVMVTWERHGRSIRIENKAWNFANGQSVPVVIHVGDVEFSGTATSNKDCLTLPLPDPIEAALARADRIGLSYVGASGVDSRFNFPIDATRLPKLVQAVKRCSKLLH